MRCATRTVRVSGLLTVARWHWRTSFRGKGTLISIRFGLTWENRLRPTPGHERGRGGMVAWPGSARASWGNPEATAHATGSPRWIARIPAHLARCDADHRRYREQTSRPGTLNRRFDQYDPPGHSVPAAHDSPRFAGHLTASPRLGNLGAVPTSRGKLDERGSTWRPACERFPVP